MIEPEQNLRAQFDALRERSKKEVALGQLDQALATCNEALDWARRHEDSEAWDLAYCSMTSLLIHQNRGEETLKELRKILMRSGNPAYRHLAAYNLSLIYFQKHDHEKSTFFSRQALDYARKSGSQDLLARSHNRQGNVMLRTSYFEEAVHHYQEALGLLPEDLTMERCQILGNMGFCQIVLGDSQEGFHNLLTTLRFLYRQKVEFSDTLCRVRLALCYGYLEIGRAPKARLHGLAALRIAERLEHSDLIKKSLYLLGEAEKISDNTGGAYGIFQRLQGEFYPENPDLPDLLMATQTHQLVNLGA